MSSDRTVDVDWQTCNQDGCIGVRLPTRPACLAHATNAAREAALKQFAEGGGMDVRGVPIAPALLEKILAAAPRDPNDRPSFTDADFRWATFEGDARFDGATFEGDARFDGATFQGYAGFERATCHGDARFDGATFEGDARFDGATFEGDAGFSWATFHRGAEFNGATFQRYAGFGEVTFHSGAGFRGATFQEPLELGPLAVADHLVLDRIVFDQPVQVEAVARWLWCRRTRFRAGGHLRVARAKISLEDAEVPVPLILSWQPPSPELGERGQWLTAAEDAPDSIPEQMPRLMSVQRADVAGLVVAGVDLRACRFAGAHHLDQLQFATAARFVRAPAWHGRGRRVLAEEYEWRQARGSWRGGRWRHPMSELFGFPPHRRRSPARVHGAGRDLPAAAQGDGGC
jgi:uncharacterized protein YjbI with pentapeptide repeats